MQLTESEKQYAAQKVAFYGVGAPTAEQIRSAEQHMAGIKQLVSIRASTPDSSGRINGCYSWQRSPWD